MRQPARARGREASHPTQPTVRMLLQDIAEGIRVLQTRDGVDVSEEQILERARNIVTGLLGNYKIRSLDGKELRVGRSRCCRWTCSISSRSAPKRATTGAPAAPRARAAGSR